MAPDGNDADDGTRSHPFRTITRAQAAVREHVESMQGDIAVYLREGTYSLSEPLQFDHRDAGRHGHTVSYRAEPGEQVVVSGGQRIVGWESVGDGLFRAPIHGLRFRQLYVDGRRAVRARTPNADEFARLIRWDEATRTIEVPRATLPADTESTGLELTVLKQWTQDTVRIESLERSGDTLVLHLKDPDRSKTFMGHLTLRLPEQPFFFENAKALLDAGGEWWADGQAEWVYYRPREGKDLDRAVVIAPVLERLVSIVGTPDDPVHDFRIHGVSFAYAGWNGPSDEGFATGQADALYSFHQGREAREDRVPAALFVAHAHDLVLEGNGFANMGGTAVTLHAGVTDTLLVGNEIHDVSGSGIVVDGVLEARLPDARLACERITIANNRIERIGLDYRSSIGIFAGFVSDTIIAHNDIHDVPYTGISVGWGWTDVETRLGRNLILGNHVARAVTTMADGAGIYLLSNQPGTEIRGNYVHDLVRSPVAGSSPIVAIYLDEGSQGMLVADNVLEHVPLALFFHHASHNRVVDTPGELREKNGSTDNTQVVTSTFDRAYVVSQAGAGGSGTQGFERSSGTRP
ncbi:MAG: right-handed parallel beta-helix repeat-containing protein [Nitrospiraceae bacterium]